MVHAQAVQCKAYGCTTMGRYSRKKQLCPAHRALATSLGIANSEVRAMCQDSSTAGKGQPRVDGDDDSDDSSSDDNAGSASDDSDVISSDDSSSHDEFRPAGRAVSSFGLSPISTHTPKIAEVRI